MNKKNILIVGGGFGGISTALALSKKEFPGAKITLVSNRSHFEYHGALYRLVTGRSPMEICIPLSEIFLGTKVQVIKDEISSIDFKKKQGISKSGFAYKYDYLVMAVGSETLYFDIPGLKKNSFGFKSISEALKLKNHLHAIFEQAKKYPKNKSFTHMVVVGGGASGVELAAELVEYGKMLAISHHIDPKNVQVDLIHSKNRLISELPVSMGVIILKRLKKLGVRVHLSTRLTREDIEKVYLSDSSLRARTLVWTAGVSVHSLHGHAHRFSFSKTDKKVEIGKDLRAKGHKNVFVIGDNASVRYTGMAQTAIAQGNTVAENISLLLAGTSLTAHVSKKPIYAIPVGKNWAATLVGNRVYFGLVGWILRRYLDFAVFKTFLPLGKALRAFLDGYQVSETCPECVVA